MGRTTKIWLTVFAFGAAAGLHASAQDASSVGYAGARVIGGFNASPGAWSFPAYILISENGDHLQCGGTLVARNFVLTAGHCATDPGSKTVHAASAYEVRLGSVDRDRDYEMHRVKRVITHEQFGQDYPLENDIALLELDTPSNLKPAVLDGMPRVGTESRLAVEEKAAAWDNRFQPNCHPTACRRIPPMDKVGGGGSFGQPLPDHSDNA